MRLLEWYKDWKLDRLIGHYRNWKFKNTALLVLSVCLFVYFLESPLIRKSISLIGDLGYLGALLAGALFVSTFTIAPASVALFYLAERLHPLEVAIIAGLGAMLGDLVIFKFFKDNVFKEISPLFSSFKHGRVAKLFETPYFAWMLPVVGAAIIASPFPDEVGLGMLGLSKIKFWQFLILTFVLNTTGIFLIVLAAQGF